MSAAVRPAGARSVDEIRLRSLRQLIEPYRNIAVLADLDQRLAAALA